MNSEIDVPESKPTDVLGCPLPRRSILGGPIVTGRLKATPEDFFVEEQPLYHPIGEGEHLYLGVHKRSASHSEMIRVLREHFQVKEAAIGFAGMKDKRAVTMQQVSIYLPGREVDSIDLHDKRVQILWSKRHTNKLRRGHLQGNRFSIRIRETNPLKVPQVLAALRKIEASGVPNYFGVQRFGYRKNTHILGLHAIRGDVASLLSELLGATGSDFPERQREARENFDAGRFEQALPGWSRNEPAERVALQALIAGRDEEGAVRAIPNITIGFWASALQSAIFNRILDARLDEGTLGAVDVGDVAMRPESRRQFVVTSEMFAEDEFQADIEQQRLSSTGPMWGRHMVWPKDERWDQENKILNSLGLTHDQMEHSPWTAHGSRRPLRIVLSNIEVDSGVDDSGGYIRTAFDLPRGAYATVVLNELLTELPPKKGS